MSLYYKNIKLKNLVLKISMTGLGKVIYFKDTVWEEIKEALESTKETLTADFLMVLVDWFGEMEIGTSEASSMEQSLDKENITWILSIELLKVYGQIVSWFLHISQMKWKV